MKKSNLSYWCVLLLIALILNSCTFPSFNEANSETSSETESKTESKTESDTTDDIVETEVTILAHLEYRTFEETLSGVTDVIIGEYRGVDKDRTTARNRYEDFAVVSQLKGEKTTDIISISTLPAEFTLENTGASFSLSKTQYRIGQTYLLLLKRSSSTDADKDKFVSVQDSLLIPLDLSQNIIKEECLLYGMKLSEHFSSQDTTEAWNNGTFLTYVLNYVENKTSGENNK